MVAGASWRANCATIRADHSIEQTIEMGLRPHDPMYRHERRHRPGTRAWALLLVLAMLLGIVGPRMGQALSRADGGWMEVCTGHGIQAVWVDDESRASDSRSGTPGWESGHCPWCLAQAKPAAPPPLHAWLAAPAAAHPPSAIRHVGPRFSMLAWRPSLPRAPPLTIVS